MTNKKKCFEFFFMTPRNHALVQDHSQQPTALFTDWKQRKINWTQHQAALSTSLWCARSFKLKKSTFSIKRNYRTFITQPVLESESYASRLAMQIAQKALRNHINFEKWKWRWGCGRYPTTDVMHLALSVLQKLHLLNCIHVMINTKFSMVSKRHINLKVLLLLLKDCISKVLKNENRTTETMMTKAGAGMTFKSVPYQIIYRKSYPCIGVERLSGLWYAIRLFMKWKDRQTRETFLQNLNLLVQLRLKTTTAIVWLRSLLVEMWTDAVSWITDAPQVLLKNLSNYIRVCFSMEESLTGGLKN